MAGIPPIPSEGAASFMWRPQWMGEPDIPGYEWSDSLQGWRYYPEKDPTRSEAYHHEKFSDTDMEKLKEEMEERNKQIQEQQQIGEPSVADYAEAANEAAMLADAERKTALAVAGASAIIAGTLASSAASHASSPVAGAPPPPPTPLPGPSPGTGAGPTPAPPGVPNHTPADTPKMPDVHLQADHLFSLLTQKRKKKFLSF